MESWEEKSAFIKMLGTRVPFVKSMGWRFLVLSYQEFSFLPRPAYSSPGASGTVSNHGGSCPGKAFWCNARSSCLMSLRYGVLASHSRLPSDIPGLTVIAVQEAYQPAGRSVKLKHASGCSIKLVGHSK
jgi:hypothetical protein